MRLLIVESPTKARTITKYLGKKTDLVVKASVGHIRDLPKSNKKAIDIANGFLPYYEIPASKKKIVDELAELALEADEILLATDPDREGEAIAWHIASILRNKDIGIPAKNIKRVVFHEITQSAVSDALAHPRTIDQNLRRAQEARRVLDRLVGYDLSGVIWKKVRYGLSAGRVQSPALRILVEREKEIKQFEPIDYWVLSANLQTLSKTDITLTCVEEPKDKKEVDRILKAAKKSKWQVAGIKESESKRSPYAPFTTSTLQQTASTRLSFAPSRTMQVAQKLYEAGHITYMRTDSTTLSKEALAQIYSEIERTHGKDMIQHREYKTKSKNAQEAHEAIRPTKISNVSAGSTPEQKKLYALIRTRAIASQMNDAKLLKTKVTANIEGASIPDFAVNGSRVLDPGWLTLDTAARGEDVELPALTEGEQLNLKEIKAEAKQTQPPNRYTEAGLVKELEKRGIGRPSTYASIIKTIVDRGYVDKEGRTLIPTDTGEVVSDFLSEHFEKYVSDTFTAEMEDELDDISRGEREYEKTLSDFYKPFAKEVKAKDKLDKITTLGDAPKEFSCPICKSKMVYKLSRGGKFMSCSKFPDCSGARTAEGKELEAPKETGEKCPECAEGKLVEREGRYGKFIACSNYPKCKFIKESEEEKARKSTGVQCPTCNKGEMVERRGRFGIFYSCSNYPDCKHAIKAKPTGKKCPECGSLMMEGTKTIPERCSVKTCPNHNPHKLDGTSKKN